MVAPGWQLPEIWQTSDEDTIQQFRVEEAAFDELPAYDEDVEAFKIARDSTIEIFDARHAVTAAIQHHPNAGRALSRGLRRSEHLSHPGGRHSRNLMLHQVPLGVSQPLTPRAPARRGENIARNPFKTRTPGRRAAENTTTSIRTNSLKKGLNYGPIN